MKHNLEIELLPILLKYLETFNYWNFQTYTFDFTVHTMLLLKLYFSLVLREINNTYFLLHQRLVLATVDQRGVGRLNDIKFPFINFVHVSINCWPWNKLKPATNLNPTSRFLVSRIGCHFPVGTLSFSVSISSSSSSEDFFLSSSFPKWTISVRDHTNKLAHNLALYKKLVCCTNPTFHVGSLPSLPFTSLL